MLRSTVLIGLALALLNAWGCFRQASGPSLNVVLISIDSLRADHVGALGYERDTSPTMDRLAREGMVFSNAISSTSWTLPAHAALFTGLPDSVHGASAERALAGGFATLAEAFADGGYRTVGFYAGPFLHPVFGLDQGFDEYVDCTSYGLGTVDRPDPRAYHQKAEADITNPIVLKELSAALDRDSARPFFFFVHLWDVHYDYIPPPPYDEMFDPDYEGRFTGENFYNNIFFKPGMKQSDFEHVVALYDGEIRFTDDTIATILGELESRGRLDDTVVVITADHGDEFLDHGSKGHRHTLYEELVRIPLILWRPGMIDAGRREEVVRIVDVAPTLLELAGLEPLEDIVGESLVGLMTGRGGEPRAALSQLTGASRSNDLTALRVGDDKVIIDHGTGSASYFDLSKNPGELEPRSADEHPRGKPLVEQARRLEKKFADMAPVFEDAPVQLDSGVKEQLRSLGYLD